MLQDAVIGQQHEHADEDRRPDHHPDRLIPGERGVDARQLHQPDRHEHTDEREQVGVGLRREGPKGDVEGREHADHQACGGDGSQIKPVRLRPTTRRSPRARRRRQAPGGTRPPASVERSWLGGTSGGVFAGARRRRVISGDLRESVAPHDVGRPVHRVALSVDGPAEGRRLRRLDGRGGDPGVTPLGEQVDAEERRTGRRGRRARCSPAPRRRSTTASWPTRRMRQSRSRMIAPSPSTRRVSRPLAGLVRSRTRGVRAGLGLGAGGGGMRSACVDSMSCEVSIAGSTPVISGAPSPASPIRASTTVTLSLPPCSSAASMSAVAASARVARAGGGLLDQRVVDHRRQPVGAEQDDVAGRRGRWCTSSICTSGSAPSARVMMFRDGCRAASSGLICP